MWIDWWNASKLPVSTKKYIYRQDLLVPFLDFLFQPNKREERDRRVAYTLLMINQPNKSGHEHRISRQRRPRLGETGPRIRQDGRAAGRARIGSNVLPRSLFRRLLSCRIILSRVARCKAKYTRLSRHNIINPSDSRWCTAVELPPN